MPKGTFSLLVASLLLFASLPATSNYMLNSYGFGAGGAPNATTSNYTVEGVTGEASGQPQSTATYADNSGYIQTQQSNIPKITLSNPGNYYDKLQFVIGTQNNPSDARYALKVASGGTDCNTGSVSYVRTDDTLSASQSIANYQTYSAWGGASGATVIGLSPGTTYYICAKATQFVANTNKITTETAYGPSSSAATVSQQLSFCVYTSSCGSSNSEAFGSLLAGNVSTSGNINVTFATNADAGGSIYIYSTNGGLKSSTASYTVTSGTVNLGSVNEGFGAQVTSASQTAGGPFTSVSPYNGSANNVGALSAIANPIFTSNAPVAGGSGVVQLQAKIAATTPAAIDYGDTLTVIAAASF